MQYKTSKKSAPSVYSAYCTAGNVSLSKDSCILKTSKERRLLHYHSCIELGYCVRGTGSTYVDQRIYRYKPGCLQVVLPYQPHLSVADEEGQTLWNYVYIDPFKLCLAAKFSNMGLLRSMLKDEIKLTGLFLPEEHPTLKNLIYSLDREISQTKRHKVELCAALVYELLIYLANLGGNQTRPVYNNSNAERIYEAIEKINHRITGDEDGDVLVETLAHDCNMSLSNFRLVFKNVTGFSPKEYITSVRLNYAEYLLLNTQYSVQAIADMTGFSTPANFHAKFQKEYGITPKAYRDSAK